MSRYRIYYADGSIYTGPAGEAPGYGVIAILQESVFARFHTISNSPYYIFLKDEWVGAWINDVEHSLVHRFNDIGGFCVGQLVTKKEFNEVHARVKVDREKMD